MLKKSSEVLLALLFALVLGIYSPGARSNPTPRCAANPIGRILSGSSDNYRTHAVVCDGAEIVNPQDVLFSCFVNQAEVRLPERDIVIEPDICTQGTVTQRPSASICGNSASGERVCSVPKGPRAISQFRVIEPDEVSGETPSIAWENVEDALSYTIYVSGPDIRWQRTVDAGITELPYPNDEPSLTTGSAYEIAISANVDEGQIGFARLVISVDETTAYHQILN